MNKIAIILCYIAFTLCVGYLIYIFVSHTSMLEAADFLTIMKMVNFGLWFLWISLVVLYLIFFKDKQK